MFDGLTPTKAFLLGFGGGKASGGGSGIIMKTGSFTLESHTSALNVEIEHNLGVVPQIIIINAPNFDSDITDVDSRKNRTFYGFYANLNGYVDKSSATMCSVYYSSNGTTISSTMLADSSTHKASFEEKLTSTKSAAISYNNAILLSAGTEYEWCAIAGIS